MSTMMLHRGGMESTMDDIRSVVTPQPTKTHYPVPHERFIGSVSRFISDGGYKIKETKHALSHKGQRYFGLIMLENEGMDGAYQWSIGLRNSHDKAFRAEVTAGSRVFVCDNLAFSGSIQAVRKHTKNVERDMDQLIARAVGQLGNYFNQNDKRYARYKETEVSEKDFGHFIVQAIEARVIPVTRVPDVIKEWRDPSHLEFAQRNAWSVFNAVTETFKKVGNSTELMTRNQTLHGVMDNFCGLALPS